MRQTGESQRPTWADDLETALLCAVAVACLVLFLAVLLTAAQP